VTASNWQQPQYRPPQRPPAASPVGRPVQFQPHPVFRPEQQYPHPHPGAEIAITAKASPFALPTGPLIYLMRIRAVVDGQLRYLPWGRFVLFLSPGPHTLRLFLYVRVVRGAVRMEVAEGVAHVNLSPGQRLELEYKAPWVVFIPGSLGPAPQPRRALWLWFVSMLLTLGCIAGLIYDAAAGGS
jgi:hypothetical protein